MKSLRNVDVVVVGLGLMGGSLAGALRGRCRSVTGVARRDVAIETAQDRALIDSGTTDLRASLSRADLVVLATPVRATIALLEEIGPCLPAGALVLDLGTTKTTVVRAMAELPPRVASVGGHPLCGSEASGVSAADPSLYRDRVFVLTPHGGTTADGLARAEALVRAIGARPVVIAAERHDALIAATVLLPYLIACGLTTTVACHATRDPLLWELAASGLRDTSRLAASDVTMMLDALMTDRGPVVELMRQSAAALAQLGGLLTRGDEAALGEALRSARTTRRRDLRCAN